MKLNEQRQGSALTMIESFDLFGVPVTLKFNERNTHKTKLGAFVTILILALFSIQIVNIILDLFNYQNMSIIFQEEMVDIPSRFELKPSKFSFAFSIMDSKLNYIMDDSIYYIDAVLLITDKVYNTTSQQYELVSKDIPFYPVPCTLNDFQIKGTENYFKGIPYKSHFCLPNNVTLALEGQFGALTYQRLRIRVKTCQGSNCKSSSTIFNKLSNSQFQIHYVNYALKLTNRTHPFQPFGQNQFWKVSNGTLKNINIYFRNAYIDSYEGMFDSSESTRYQSLIYSFDREQSIQQYDNTILEAYINLEKTKESHYFRRYKTFSQALSELGGLFNFILCVCSVICYPISCLLFKQNLLNSIFSFQNQSKPINKSLKQADKKPIKSRSSLLAAQMFKKYHQGLFSQCTNNSPQVNKSNNNNRKSITLNESQKSPINYILSQDQLIGNNQNSSIVQQINSTIDPGKITPRKSFIGNLLSQFNSPTNKKEIEEQSPQLHKSSQFDIQNRRRTLSSRKQQSQQQQLEKQQKKVQSSFINKLFNYKNERKISFLDLLICIVSKFLSYLPLWRMSSKSKMIDYSLSKLNLHLDVYYIIDKLLELEKLKKLLLNKEQIKLFDLIPKPLLSSDLFDSNTLQPNNDSALNNHIFYETNKSHTQKVQDAQDAFNILFSKQEEKSSKINKKLLSLLDPQILVYLENNLFKLEGAVTQSNISESNQFSALVIPQRPQYPQSQQNYQQQLQQNEQIQIELAGDNILLSNVNIPEEEVELDVQMVSNKLSSNQMNINRVHRNLNNTIS